LQRRRRDLDHRPDGQKLGRIIHGAPATNIAFGGDDWKTLYLHQP
jgi:sugar lactone lactonase YvrE